MGKPKVDIFDYMFETGNTFSVTEDEYKRITGEYLPKSGNYYICNRSAVAKHAAKFGYKIHTNIKVLTFEKDN